MTIQWRGVISRNKAVHDLMGNAGRVELLHDRDRAPSALRRRHHRHATMEAAPAATQKVPLHLTDDLDGGPSDDTITFAIDGRSQEIDLAAASTEELRETLRPCAAH